MTNKPITHFFYHFKVRALRAGFYSSVQRLGAGVTSARVSDRFKDASAPLLDRGHRGAFQRAGPEKLRSS